jgi:FO synthase
VHALSSASHQTSLARADAERIVARAVDEGQLERRSAEGLAANLMDPLIREAVLEGAAESKRRGKGDIVSVSKNVFIPLTNLCRDRCAYCTFAKPPDSPDAKTYSLSEVADVVRRGVETGCREALFCLGDKPEVAYRSYREWLAANGLRNTTDYLVQACRIGFEGGILPHTNAGILSATEMAELRAWNASLGLMLESTSTRLREKGMAHYYCPDKEPSVRIRMHEEAGELRIPFTSGLLLGIGEDAVERVDTLLTIRELDARFGHIQEVIVQPFHAKDQTPMADFPSLSDNEVALNDWGGVSPLTVDFINPEAPWPALRELRRRTEAAGQRLVERLPVYPAHLLHRPDFFAPQVRAAALDQANAAGFAKPSPAETGVEAA